MNKKIIVIVVLAECIISIFLISFVGKAIEDAFTNVLCKSLYFVDENGEVYDENQILEVSISDTSFTYKLRYKMGPKDVTNREVEFLTDVPEDKVIVDGTGKVTFIDAVTVQITIRAKDGSGQMDTITLVPIRDISGDID